MQYIKSIVGFGLFLSLIVSSCNSDRKMVEATVINTGDITYEGCGYVLELQNHEILQPIYLPSDYQINNLEVKVKYSHSGMQDTCDFGTVIYDLIDIEKIQRR
ncbi:MAG TPA: hypothetical protein VK027_05910 [Chitinophagaceae bacterium]|nr:hypothetical protein [Chitinophagaceae bacterium]